MKRAILLLIIFGLFIPFIQGCDTDKKSIIRKTNAIYTGIKIIVTDKEVSPLISEDNKNKLREAEKKYLSAVKILEKSDIDIDSENASLKTIVECADIIIEILDLIELSDEYREKITVIRISLNVIRTQLE